MGTITTAMSIASAYSQDSFYSSSSIPSSHSPENAGATKDDGSQTPTSSFQAPKEIKPLPPALSSSELDEDERIFPRHWLSFSSTVARAPAQPSLSSEHSDIAAIPPHRSSVHARLLRTRRPTLDALPPVPVPSIPSTTLIPSLDGTSVDDNLPTRRRGLHSTSSNTRSRDNDARRWAMAFSPSSALDWELVEGMGILSPEEANGDHSALVPEDEHGQYLSFALPSPTIPSINHKLPMGLPEPRPISQLIVSPPSSSAVARYSRQKVKGKSAKTRARRVSGVPARHRRFSGGAVTSKLLRPPRTPRTPQSPGVRKQSVLSPSSSLARARAPRRLPSPPGLKAAKPGESPTSTLPRSDKGTSGSSDSWEDVKEEDGAPGGGQETGNSDSLPVSIVQVPDTHCETSSPIQSGSASQSKPIPLHSDRQRRATMMNALLSRFSIDSKSLKRNRKTLAAVSRSSGSTERDMETALPALAFSPITLDIPDVPTLPYVDSEKAGSLHTRKDEQTSEAGGLQRVRSLRSSHPLAPSSKTNTTTASSTSPTDAPTSMTSLAPQFTLTSRPQPVTTTNPIQRPPQRKSLHPPSSFGLKPKGHQRTASSPALGGFKISAPTTNSNLMSLEAEDIKPISAMQHEESCEKSTLKRTHRRAGSHGSRGSRTLFSPPPPLPSDSGHAIPPLPAIPRLPPMPSFVSADRNGTKNTVR